jgi:transposase
MPNGMRWVGLDVHAHASAVAVFDDVSGEVVTRRVVGRPIEVLDVLRELPRPLRAVYEVGPTGYGLVRRARAEGIEMAVCSPGNIERRPGDRIKTDKRDAIRLARLFAAGDLRLVWIPSEEQEQLRDLVRCREDLRSDLMRARHRLATFLLRRERSVPGPGGRWTLKHRPGSHNSTSRTRHHGSRTPTIYTRTTSCWRAVTASVASSSSSPPTARGPRRSRGCAACAGSTP